MLVMKYYLRNKSKFDSLSFVLMFVFLISSQNTFAQLSKSFSNKSAYADLEFSFKDYSKSYVVDTYKYFTAPVSFTGTDWAITGGLAVIGYGIYTQDDKIQKYVSNRIDAGTERFLYDYVDPWSTGVFPSFLFGGILAYGFIADSDKHKVVVMDGAKAFLISGAITTFLKYGFRRERPFVGGDNPNKDVWFGEFMSDKYTSFPSGHTTAYFALAAVLETHFKDQVWVGIASYSLAAVTGVSRVYNNKHWASDVFVGALVGWSVGKIVANANYNNWKASPYYNTQAQAQGVSMVFNL